MKKKPYLIPLILGLVLLAVGIGCFTRVCAVKDSIYSAYKVSFSDASINEVFINDHDEATVKADFDAAMLASARSGNTASAATEEIPVEGEEAAAEEAIEEAAEEAAEEEAVEMPVGHLYRVAADTNVTDKNGGFIGAATEGEIYTSYDELDIAEFGTGKQIEIDYLSQKGFLPADDLNEVMSAVVLPTSGNSIMKDEYSGSYPCDPENSDVIAAAALVNSQKLRSWDKADLISAESILEAEGDLVKLIDDYSGGDLIAQKLTDVSESAIRSQIDSGKRVLLAVRYYNGVTDFDYSDYYGVTSETRYVIVCGYDEDEEYGNIFYCCDPFYGQGGRSLATVSAETLCTSAGLVDDARKGMIILK